MTRYSTSFFWPNSPIYSSSLFRFCRMRLSIVSRQRVLNCFFPFYPDPNLSSNLYASIIPYVVWFMKFLGLFVWFVSLIRLF